MKVEKWQYGKQGKVMANMCASWNRKTDTLTEIHKTRQKHTQYDSQIKRRMQTDKERPTERKRKKTKER